MQKELAAQKARAEVRAVKSKYSHQKLHKLTRTQVLFRERFGGKVKIQSQRSKGTSRQRETLRQTKRRWRPFSQDWRPTSTPAATTGWRSKTILKLQTAILHPMLIFCVESEFEVQKSKMPNSQLQGRKIYIYYHKKIRGTVDTRDLQAHEGGP